MAIRETTVKRLGDEEDAFGDGQLSAGRCLRRHALRPLVFFSGAALAAFAAAPEAPLSPTNIFAPVSTPAQSIFDLSRFVLLVTGGDIHRRFQPACLRGSEVQEEEGRDGREPAQVYGSTQLELAWTVIPVLIVVVLFLATARVIAEHPERRAAGQRHRSHRDRAPVLVGVSISIAESSDRE